MSFNKIFLVGNLGSDPELRYTPQGSPVCSFSMATNERKKDKQGEFQEQTTWFRVTLWGRAAENASEHLAKGHAVYIEGRLRVEDWTDRGGKPRYTLEVHGLEMQFLDTRPRETPEDGRPGTGDRRPAKLQESLARSVADDDLPF